MPLSPLRLVDRWRAPAPHAARIAFLAKAPYAHRGLHDQNTLENSPAAFAAALAQGHGIECDVQAASDGTAFTFHDFELHRLTGVEGSVASKSAAMLDLIMLKDGHGKIPRLRETLTQIDGQVPLLVEIKTKDRSIVPLCLSVRRALEGYRGPAAIMAFDPMVSDWFRRQAPHIVRGLVVSEQEGKGWRRRIKRHRDLWRAKPDFLAYDIRDLPSKFAAQAKKRGMPVLTWTVRTAAQEETALAHASEIIYEMPQDMA